MWGGLLRLGKYLLRGKRFTGVGSGSKFLAGAKNWGARALQWAKNLINPSAAKAATNSKALSVYSKAVGQLSSIRMSRVAKASLLKRLLSSGKNMIKSKEFWFMLGIEGGFLAVDYLVNEEGFDEGDARALVDVLLSASGDGAFYTTHKLYDVTDDEGLSSVSVNRLNTIIQAITSIRHSDDTSGNVGVEELYRDVDRDIAAGKLVQGLYQVLGATSKHKGDDEAERVRLKLVRALLYGTGYVPGDVNESSDSSEYVAGADGALTNILVADTDFVSQIGNALVSDYDNIFDFDDVDKDEEYYKRIAFFKGVISGRTDTVYTDLDIEEDDIHEQEVMKDIKLSGDFRSDERSIRTTLNGYM